MRARLNANGKWERLYIVTYEKDVWSPAGGRWVVQKHEATFWLESGNDRFVLRDARIGTKCTVRVAATQEVVREGVLEPI